MGEFIWMCGIAGAKPDAVEAFVRAAVNKQGGQLEEAPAACEDANALTLCWSEPDRVVLVYPVEALDPEKFPSALSRGLGASVFDFHIHDGDIWVYTLYSGGKKKDRFNPRPDYWGPVSNRERRAWQGSAELIAREWPNLQPDHISRYLVPWDQADVEKAYPNDGHAYGDCWQVVDFMRRLGLPDPTGEVQKKCFIRTDTNSTSLLAAFGLQPKPPSTLHLAAGKGDQKRVLALLAQGADLEEEDASGQTPMCWAVQNGKLDMVKLLLSRGARLEHHGGSLRGGGSPDIPGTLLHVASAWGHCDVAACLIDEGCDVDACDPSGDTPLHVVVPRKRRGMIELLLERGANPNLRNANGWTPLGYAALQYPEIIPFLREHGARGTLHEAAGIGDVQLLEEWLRETPEGIEARDPQEQTPLHVAALCGSMAGIEFLLSKGADPSARNRIQQTPLHAATMRGSLDAVKRLIAAGAELDVVDMALGAPLHDAVSFGHLDIMRCLLDAGANVNCRDGSGLTPLDSARHVSRNREAMDLLKEYGARPGQMMLRLVRPPEPPDSKR